jgi:hypothetical protein
MNTDLNYALAQGRIDDLHRAGERERRAAATRAAGRGDRPLTIRMSRPADREPITRVARLDSQWPPGEPLLVAEVDEEIVAALSLETGVVIANPFKRTADVVALLRLRAEQLTVPRRRERLARRRLGFGRAVADSR